MSQKYKVAKLLAIKLNLILVSMPRVKSNMSMNYLKRYKNTMKNHCFARAILTALVNTIKVLIIIM